MDIIFDIEISHFNTYYTASFSFGNINKFERLPNKIFTFNGFSPCSVKLRENIDVNI